MTPQKIQSIFKEAMTNKDIDVAIETLQHDDMDLDFRDVTHDLETPLMQLCHSTLDDKNIMTSLIDVIHSRRPDVELQDALGRTLAMHACIASRVSILRYVLSRDVDVTVCDRTGKNIFHYGAGSGNGDIMDLLLDHPKAKSALKVLDFKGFSPLDLARQSRAQCIVKKISHALSEKSNSAASNRQPLKPIFKSSLDQQRRAVPLANDTISANRVERGDPTFHGDLLTTSQEVEPEDIQSSSGEFSSSSYNQENGESTRQPHRHGNLSRLNNSSQSPIPHPRSKRVHKSSNTFSSGCSPSPETDNSEDFVTEDSSEQGYFSSERDNDGRVPKSHLTKPTLLASQASVSINRHPETAVKKSESKSINSISAQRSLAPIVSPRRKINLDVDPNVGTGRTTSMRSTSAETGLSHLTAKSKPRQVISEIRSDSNKYARPATFNESGRESNTSDKNNYPSRQEMSVPFKSKQALGKLNAIKSSEAGNLNALLSPQLTHKRLLQKRLWKQDESPQKSDFEKNSDAIPNTNADREEDNPLFEEEISLDSSLSSDRLSNQTSSRLQARRSSLSLPDLRDMTGCLVTSRGVSPSKEENERNNIVDEMDCKDKSPMQYYSDEEDDDYDEAVHEDDLSDDCIEDCFDTDGHQYPDMISSSRLSRANNKSKTNPTERPLPTIQVSTPRKGKSFLKP